MLPSNLHMHQLHYSFRGLLLALLLLSGIPASAQKLVQDPVQWRFSIKKQGAGRYILMADATIQPKWHIYAIKPGGEGELIGTSFKFDKGGAAVSGSVKELTPAKQEKMMDEKVNLHSGKAKFSITVTGRQGQTISGTVEYQACNDMMCLPPKTYPFSVKLP